LQQVAGIGSAVVNDLPGSFGSKEAQVDRISLSNLAFTFLRPVRPDEVLLQKCVKVGGPCGLIDTEGKEVLAPLSGISGFSMDDQTADGQRQMLVFTDKGTGVVAAVEDRGQWLVRPGLNIGGYVRDGLIRAERDGKWGYLNTAGETKIDFQFDVASDFSDGVAVVKRNDKYGLINTEGSEIAPFKYDLIMSFHDDLAGFSRLEGKGSAGFLTRDGEEVMSGSYISVDNFKNGYARVFVSRGSEGLISRSGEWVVPPKFETASYLSEGLAAVRVSGKGWGYVDENGYPVIKPQFNEAGDFSEGLAAVRKGKKWGYINHDGAFVIKAKFDGAGEFESGVAAVNLGGRLDEYSTLQGGRWGVIDENGKWILKANFEIVAIHRGVVYAHSNNRTQYFRNDGTKIGETAEESD
jgi:hypothetical protein